jgi:hypothetical protein
MSFLAAKSAALPHLTPRPLPALTSTLKTGNGSGEMLSFRGPLAAPWELGFGRTSAARVQMATLVPYGSAVSYPVLYSVTASGPNRRPAARRRSASATPPFQGLGSSQNKFVNARQSAPHKLLPGPAKKALLGTWEPGPLARLRHV